MEPSCLFCLEPVKVEEIRNPIGCRCKISAHKACFEQWFVQKNHMECPICHTISFPHRLTNPDVHVVYINSTQANESTTRRKQHHQAAVYCCCMLLGWAIGISVIEGILSS